jgi:hypothetical protein
MLLPMQKGSLCLVVHAAMLLWLLTYEVFTLFSEFRLFVLLCVIARRTAAGAETILASIARETIFGAHIPTLDHWENEVKTET